MVRFFLVITTMFTVYASAQKFADKEYYLVDSLVYENIAPHYQQLIETYIDMYHQSETVMQKVTAVNQIVKNCWDENVWPKYNQWVYEYTTEQLKYAHHDTVRFQLLQAQAGAIYYIAWNYGVKTEYDQAIFYYEKSKAIYTEIGDSIGIANTLDYIGNTYLVKGELPKALDYFQQALQIRLKIGDKLGTGASFSSIGGIYYLHGDYLAARNEFKQALELHSQLNFTSGISSALNNLGSIEMYFGNYDEALIYYNKSFQLSSLMGDKQGMAKSLSQIGTIALLQKKYTNAMEHFENCLSLFNEVSDQKGIAGTYRNIGRVYLAKNKFKKAVQNFEKCLTIANEKGIASEKKSSIESLFFAYMQMNQPEMAEEYILELIELSNKDVDINFSILPEQKKELYLSTLEKDFMNLYAFTSLRHEKNPSITGVAYDNVLKLKGLLLKSTAAIRENILSSGNQENINLYYQWIKLKEEIASLYAIGEETSEKEKMANAIETELVKKSSDFNQFTRQEKISWKDIQNHLKEDEIALEFIQYHRQLTADSSFTEYAALLIKKSDEFPHFERLCNEEELKNVLGITQSNNLQYIQKIYGTKNEPDFKIYKLIWQPIEKYLSETKRIYFAPTGILHKVSFQALSNENKELLCDRYELIHLSSTSQVLFESDSKIKSESVVSLFGGVKYSTEKTTKVIWNYLPGSLTETDSIYTRLKNSYHVNVFKETLASEENFKSIAPESNILHIASHGFFYPDPELIQKATYYEEKEENLDFRGNNSGYVIWNFVNNKNPLMRSGIALANANDTWQRTAFDKGEDGVLTAQEVTTLNLRNTQLVVLSACETALGDIKGNEGVYGLQRAFKMAGAKYLIISLWQVPDQETSEFMILFYSHLMLTNDIRHSFRKAQKEMRKKYDPYFWAAFILIE